MGYFPLPINELDLRGLDMFSSGFRSTGVQVPVIEGQTLRDRERKEIKVMDTNISRRANSVWAYWYLLFAVVISFSLTQEFRAQKRELSNLPSSLPPTLPPPLPHLLYDSVLTMDSASM